MASWQTLQSIAIFFGPLLLPRAIAFYRSIRYSAPSQIKPVPKATSYALGLLFLSAVLSLLSTLPMFAAENIFQLTQSRLGTIPGVLFSRLHALRPLTPADQQLLDSFNTHGLDAKLTYLKFGPDVLLSNTLTPTPAAADAERYNLVYALPALLWPHILHLVVIGLATSPLLVQPSGAAARWRTLAVLPALALPLAELYALGTGGAHAWNRRSTRVADMLPLHWRLPVYRGLALAALDAVLGYAIWLTATGRAFAAPVPVGERLLGHLRTLEGVMLKLKGVGVVRNGSVRDAGLRGRVEGYWRKEQEVMRSVMEDPEVLEAQRAALKRVDSVRVMREIEGFVESLVTSPGTSAGAGQRA